MRFSFLDVSTGLVWRWIASGKFRLQIQSRVVGYSIHIEGSVGSKPFLKNVQMSLNYR